MKTKQIKLLIVQSEIILEQARKLEGQGEKILRNEGDVSYYYYLSNIDKMVKQFNLIVPKINKLLEKEGIAEKLDETKEVGATLKQIREENVFFNADGLLFQLIFGASNILSFLREGVVLSETTLDKLDSLSEELDNLKEKLSEESYNNLKEATDSFEKGCFLGSSLISGRVIRSCLDKINGKDINEKIDSLKEIALIQEKGGKDSIFKSNHFGRNLTSHDLNIMPTSSEAISYLGDAIKIAKIIFEYESKKTPAEDLNPEPDESPK